MILVRRPLAVATLALIGFASCSDKQPSTPTVVATPTPTPTPVPTPTATPRITTCTLPENDDCGSRCCTKGGTELFTAEIEAAQDALERSSPDLFEDDGSLAVDEEVYTAALAKKITEMTGICCRGGGRPTSISKDEVACKRNNNVSQNTDVILGSNNSPFVGGVYTCRPASF